jgi:predicted site-specific integrase-resolvase
MKEKKNKSGLMSRMNAAKHLGLERQTLVRLEKRGLLTPLRLNARRVLYRRSEIESLIERWAQSGMIETTGGEQC